MIITIQECDENYLFIGSKDKRFNEAWGVVNRTSKTLLFTTMQELSEWAKKKYNEECTFEVK